jgi:tetratricopeptide (TPR) repeat protein
VLTRLRAPVLLWRARRYWWLVRTTPERRVAIAERAVAMLRRRPTPALAWALTVQCDRQVYAGRAIGAEAAAREVLTIVGDTPGLARGDARLGLARAVGLQGRHDEATSLGEAALADYRTLPSSARATGRICEAMYFHTIHLDNGGRFDEALGLAERLDAVSTRLFPWIVRTWWRHKCHHAGLLARAGRCEEALKTGKAVLGPVEVGARFDPGVRPTSAQLLWYLANCHGDLGQHEEAVALSARAVAGYWALGPERAPPSRRHWGSGPRG